MSPAGAAAPPPGRWQVAGASAHGAAHVREGLPNQDAIATWTPGADAGAIAIVAVADGHGGARHFRSAIGAGIAVQATVEALRTLAPRLDAGDAPERSRIAAVDVPTRIVAAWSEGVRRHLAAAPLTEAELRAVEAAEGRAAREAVAADPQLAYGATLLGAAAAGGCALLAQLGDGDILAVAPDGTTSRPLPADERLIGNRTTSLCQPGAAGDFRTLVVDTDRAPVALLVLATDGYANSFRADAGFLQVGGDLLRMLGESGIAAVREALPGFLADASANGSGDDVTVGLLARADPRPAGAPQPETSLTWDEPAAPPPPAAPRRRASRTAWIAALIVAAAAIGWTAREVFRESAPPNAAAGEPRPVGGAYRPADPNAAKAPKARPRQPQ